jgi:hypothetical protein
MERGRESILSVSRASMGHGNAQATSVPKLELPSNIRLESGDIVLESEGDANVAPEVDGVPDGKFRWREREA